MRTFIYMFNVAHLTLRREVDVRSSMYRQTMRIMLVHMMHQNEVDINFRNKVKGRSL